MAAASCGDAAGSRLRPGGSPRGPPRAVRSAEPASSRSGLRTGVHEVREAGQPVSVVEIDRKGTTKTLSSSCRGCRDDTECDKGTYHLTISVTGWNKWLQIGMLSRFFGAKLRRSRLATADIPRTATPEVLAVCAVHPQPLSHRDRQT